MKKTLYSLMLSEDVVREIDSLAHRRGTNRSALVNQILADYVNLTTPERRINDIFTQIGELLSADRELVPFVAPGASTMSMKSSLQYRYRPTVKYSVELYRDRGLVLGELSVVFRTQSEELLYALDSFFHVWKEIEDTIIGPYHEHHGQTVEYALYPGRFTRSLVLPEGRDYSTNDIAAAISDYVRLFDTLLKKYLGGYVTKSDMLRIYSSWLQQGSLIL